MTHQILGDRDHTCRWCGRTMHEVAGRGAAVFCVSEPLPGHVVPGFSRVRASSGREVLVKVTRDRAGNYRIAIGAEPPRALVTDTDLGRFPPGALAPLLPLWWVEDGRVVHVVRVVPHSYVGPHVVAVGEQVFRVLDAGPGLGIAVWSHPQGGAHMARDEWNNEQIVERALTRARGLWAAR